jgi:hypothetical protein
MIKNVPVKHWKTQTNLLRKCSARHALDKMGQLSPIEEERDKFM